MRDTGSEQLFLQAAERAGWQVEDAAVRKRLETLYREYLRLCVEDTETVLPEEVRRTFTEADWNDEDVDVEDEDRSIAELSDWTDKEDAAVPDSSPAAERAKGAAEYFALLREVTTEAKRILKDLEETFSKGKTGNTAEDQAMLKTLRVVARLDQRSTPGDAEAALASLEEAAYQCMVGKKGFFGIRNSVMQKTQELAKEGWALAGQAQVDLDISVLPPEDPKSRIDPDLPLIRQMEQDPNAVQVPNASGRLQRLVRFDDLQADLRSQEQKRPFRK